MKFEESKYFKDNETYKLELPFGNFYLCEKFFVGEANEGIHLDFNKLKKILTFVTEFYDTNSRIGFIANRVNAYSIDLTAYNQVEKEFGIIQASAVVVYSEMAFMNATIEKRMTSKSIKRCVLLEEAIDWILNIKELN